ncbi:MAG: hypothetical protein SGPRY_008838 [Prymnesium sp.]
MNRTPSNRSNQLTAVNVISKGPESEAAELPMVTIVMRHSKYNLIRSSSEAINRGTAFRQVQMAPTRLGVDPYFELDGPQTEVVVEPLDAAADMPEGLSFDVWDRLVEARTHKIESEEEMKLESNKLAAMTSYLMTLTAMDDQLKTRIHAVTEELEVRREAELRATWNLELPFKLKQGQIEVEEAAVVTDFSDALLIHRSQMLSQVKTLNDQIRALGAEKVQILTEVRNFRKLIVMLQWENKRADMEAIDLVERTKEFQLLRVTKDLQSKIRGGSEENQQACSVWEAGAARGVRNG